MDHQTVEMGRTEERRLKCGQCEYVAPATKAGDHEDYSGTLCPECACGALKAAKAPKAADSSERKKT